MRMKTLTFTLMFAVLVGGAEPRAHAQAETVSIGGGSER